MLNLSKGKPALNLTKSNKNVTEYTVGLAWDGDVDYDASVVILNNGSRQDIVYYGNLSAAGIQHKGDALDGSASGDDEQIDINLAQVEGDELIVAITSYNCGNFKAEDNPVAKLYNKGSTTPLVEANLSEEAAFGTALTLVRFYKEGSDWKFTNISDTVGSSANGLEDIVNLYK